MAGPAIASLVLALASGAAAEPPFFAGSLQLSTGFDWSTGSYGSGADTTTLYLPTTIAYRWEAFPLTPTPRDELELRVTLPYLRVDGPGDVIDGRPVVTDPPAGSATEVRDGLGDVILRGIWRLFPEASSALPVLELGGRLKIPSADRDRGLGSGELDGALQAGLAQRLGPFWLFGHGGYRFLGDPARAPLRDGPFASGGTSLRIAERYGVGLAYDWRRSATSGGEDVHELVPFAWADWGDCFRVGPYGVFGLAEGSPDYAAGLQLSVRVPLR